MITGFKAGNGQDKKKLGMALCNDDELDKSDYN
jgi:hypothetical protein